MIVPTEKMALTNGLKTDSSQKMFSEYLYLLLYGENELEERFKNFSQCLTEIDAGKWTIVTYFLFMTFPDIHMFLKPKVTVDAADVCGFELNYRPEINWLIYSSLLKFSHYLFTALEELKPRDMIDVQSFIWCVARIAQGEYKKQQQRERT